MKPGRRQFQKHKKLGNPCLNIQNCRINTCCRKVTSQRIMDQLKRNAIECLRSLHRDDVLNQRDEHASSRGNVITTKGSSPCKTSSSSPAVLKKSIMPMKKRIFAEIDCDLPSTQKRMKNGHDLTVISSCVGNKKNGIPTTISSDSCSTRQEKQLYDAEKRSIMSVKNQKQTKQENNHSVPKKTLDTGIERQDGKGIDEKNKREEVLEGSSPSPVVLQEYSYFKHGRVNCNKFPVKVSITSKLVLMEHTTLLRFKSSRRMVTNSLSLPCVFIVDGYFRVWPS